MSESAIEQELIKITNVNRRRKEDYQDYMQRMCDAIDSIPADDWETMSEEAQEFANTLITAEKAKEDYPELPDIEEEKRDPGDGDENAGDGESEGSDNKGDDDVSTATETSEGKSRRGRKASSDKEAKSEKTERKEKKEKAPREMSLRRQLKIWVAKKPKSTVDELIERASKAGFKEFSEVSVASVRTSVRDTLKVAKDAGVVLADLDF